MYAQPLCNDVLVTGPRGTVYQRNTLLSQNTALTLFGSNQGSQPKTEQFWGEKVNQVGVLGEIINATIMSVPLVCMLNIKIK